MEKIKNKLILPYCVQADAVEVFHEAHCENDRAYLIDRNGKVIYFLLYEGVLDEDGWPTGWVKPLSTNKEENSND